MFNPQESRFGVTWMAKDAELSENYTRDKITGEDTGEVRGFFIDMGKDPVVIDAQGASWNRIPTGDGKFTFTDAVAYKAKKAGKQGVIIHNVKDGDNVPRTIYGVFKPEQIKSADAITKDDRGRIIPLDQRFDKSNPDARYSTAGDKLVAYHNISAANIMDAGKGLIAPSIAITKEDAPFTNYGEITLIGNKNLVDPTNRRSRVFEGDIYSPTVPPKNYYVSPDLKKRMSSILGKARNTGERNAPHLTGVLREFFDEQYGSNFTKDVSRNNAETIAKRYPDELKIAYLVDKGKPLRVPTVSEKQYLWGNLPIKLTLEETAKIKPLVERWRRLPNKYTSGEITAILWENVRRQFDDETMYDMEDDIRKSFKQSVGDYAEIKETIIYKLERVLYPRQLVDTGTLGKQVNSRVKDSNKDYQAWLRELIADNQGQAYFEQGNKKVNYTPENLLEAMTTRLKGAQKLMTYGINQAKSFAMKEFSNIDQMHKKKQKIMSDEQVAAETVALQQRYFKVADSIPYQYESQWSKLDDFGKSLADYYKSKNAMGALRKNGFKLTKDSIDDFKDFADDLKNSPVLYFEAKIQDIVPLSEFSGAVVPKGTPKDVVQNLKDAGIKVKFYDGDNRVQVTKDFTSTLDQKGVDVKFSTAQTDTPQFRRWFGDSKVVDADGKPLVVYHGSDDEFTVFDMNKAGSSTGGFLPIKGMFFSKNKDHDSHLPEERDRDNLFRMPVYLSIKNPLYYDNWDDLLNKLAEGTEINPDSIDDGIGEVGLKLLKDKGYDGAIYRYKHPSLDMDEIIVIDPAQIKSATGNSGAFDTGNADIRYSTKDEVRNASTSLLQQFGLKKIIADFENLYKKHSDYFKNPLEAQLFTEEVLSEPDMLIYDDPKERENKRLVLRMTSRWGLAALDIEESEVKSVYPLHERDIRRKIQRANREGGRILVPREGRKNDHSGPATVTFDTVPVSTAIHIIHQKSQKVKSDSAMYSTTDTTPIPPAVQKKYLTSAYTALLQNRHGMDNTAYRDAMIARHGKDVEPYLDDFRDMYRETRKRLIQAAQKSALANIGETPEARNMVEDVDADRAKQGKPETRSDANDVNPQVDTMLSNDYEGTRQKIYDIGNSGGILNDVQTVAAKRIFNDLVNKAVVSGKTEDYKAASTFFDAYRDSGSEIGRAFRQRGVPKDPVSRGHWLLEYAMQPGTKLQKQIETQQRRKNRQNATTDEKIAAQAEIDNLRGKRCGTMFHVERFSARFLLEEGEGAPAESCVCPEIVDMFHVERFRDGNFIHRRLAEENACFWHAA